LEPPRYPFPPPCPRLAPPSSRGTIVSPSSISPFDHAASFFLRSPCSFPCRTLFPFPLFKRLARFDFFGKWRFPSFLISSYPSSPFPERHSFPSVPRPPPRSIGDTFRKTPFFLVPGFSSFPREKIQGVV